MFQVVPECADYMFHLVVPECTDYITHNQVLDAIKEAGPT